MALGDKSFFTPFSTLLNIFKKTLTVAYPKEDINVHGRPGASDNYRGMHTNDLEVCIGCGTCSDVCPTAAIVMQDTGEDENEIDPTRKPEQPVIDYGRCCFCAFCVDSCPSGSLSMSRDYIYTSPSIEEEPLAELEWKVNKFTIKPDANHEEEKSWISEVDLAWLDYVRSDMEHHSPEKRVQSFIEIVHGFSRQQALKEAQRCLECGICTRTCPAHMHIPEYIRAIYDEDLKKSVNIMYETNPLPAVCGRICTHKCETVCALSHRGEPIAIRWLKRYAVDNVKDEDLREVATKNKDVIKSNGKKIGIIGSGPAGLAAAYYLSGMGYQVTIYEKHPKAGGTMRYGIPSYRLPDEALDREISQIEAMGVEIKLNCEVGQDKKWKDLKQETDAIIIATGFPTGRSTRIDKTNNPNVRLAITMLNEIRLGKEIDVHRKIAVIGGGNVAMDIARSMARLQKDKFGEVDITVTSLESREEMPADDEEIEEGKEEGIVFKPGRSPLEVKIEDEKVRGLEVCRCLSVFDENGRFSPKVDKNIRECFPATMVIEAIGQAADYSFLTENEQNLLNIHRGTLMIKDGYQTGMENIFVAGDIVNGPDVIHAIADGHKAAQEMDTWFFGKRNLPLKKAPLE